jgi:hypothetical protein
LRVLQMARYITANAAVAMTPHTTNIMPRIAHLSAPDIEDIFAARSLLPVPPKRGMSVLARFP